MRSQGAPLWFLAAVTICWIGARIALLWPQTGSLEGAIDALVPARPPPSVPPPVMPIETPPLKFPPRQADPAPYIPVAMPGRPSALPVAVQSPLVVAAPASIALPIARRPDGLAFAIFPRGADPPVDRWSASGWFVARGGRGTGAAPGGQLGGGQAGARFGYLLAPRQRISAFARVTAPLAGKGSEAAVGIEWQLPEAPIRLVVEQRIGIDTPGGTGAGVTAGLYHEAGRFRIEGYGQAGAVLRHRIEPYADGAIRITRAIAPRLSLGAGAWGGAQRGAERLDIGPSATLALGPARLSLDWRQRIAGRAHPGSGLALTLGGDF